MATDPATVEALVGAAHGDLDKVKELLSENATLANATWDWGGGDWETALGAAAHMGRRDIAECLMAQGARMDLFAAAMLGELDVVKAIIAADPPAANHPGPHGISLLDHAESGGDAAADVAAYL
ncbi:MAG: ankyrin repeat domain-containing protein, partial [Candidatus Poribacteria bacterium]